MKIIFFGLGSIGGKHAKILLKSYKHEVYAFRSGTDNSPNELGIAELHSWDEVKNLKPDIAFITNPTSLHIETAIKCAQLNCKLFIEKPIGQNLYNLHKLLELLKKRNLVTYVAYNLRFHPVIKKLKDYLSSKKPLHIRVICTSFLPKWRSNTNYLKSYSANTQMGGGVILDLSHELDYTYYLLNNIQRINGSFARLGKVTIDAEDYADMLVSTSSCPVNIHINFLSHFRQRFIQMDFENSTVIGDVINAEIKEYQHEELKNTVKLDYKKGQEYEEQIKYFFDNIENPKMMNNLLEAVELYKKIINFKNEN